MKKYRSKLAIMMAPMLIIHRFERIANISSIGMLREIRSSIATTKISLVLTPKAKGTALRKP